MRNSALKENLESASGNLEECDSIIKFAEASLVELRSSLETERDEKLVALNADCEAAISASRDKVNAEVNAALAGIEKDRTVVLANMDKEIEGFCWEILEKVLPSEAKDFKTAEPALFN